jgi:hypothetical protein
MLGGQIGNFFLPISSPIGANRRQMPIGAHINLPILIGANFGLA